MRENFAGKFIDVIYDRFVQRVADGREMSLEGVDRIGKGRVWTGRRAYELGLVDELGGFGAAVRAVKELAQIPEEEDVRLVDLPEREPWWSAFWGASEIVAEPPMVASRVLHGIRPLAIAARCRGIRPPAPLEASATWA